MGVCGGGEGIACDGEDAVATSGTGRCGRVPKPLSQRRRSAEASGRRADGARRRGPVPHGWMQRDGGEAQRRPRAMRRPGGAGRVAEVPDGPEAGKPPREEASPAPPRGTRLCYGLKWRGARVAGRLPRAESQARRGRSRLRSARTRSAANPPREAPARRARHFKRAARAWGMPAPRNDELRMTNDEWEAVVGRPRRGRRTGAAG